jgi:hypothetical protein
VSLWRPETLRIGVDRNVLVWQHAGRTQEAPTLQGLARAVEQTRRRRLEAVAGNDLAQYWIQRAPAGVRSLAELRQVAGHRCAALFGGAASDWWVEADWNVHEPFVCAALPRSLTGPLALDARRCGATLRWRTCWSSVLRSQRVGAGDGWMASRGPARVLLWHARKGKPLYVTSLVSAPGEDDQALQRRLQQELALACSRDPDLGATPIELLRTDTTTEAGCALAWGTTP